MSKKDKKPPLYLVEPMPSDMWEQPCEIDSSLLYIKGQLMQGSSPDENVMLERDLVRLDAMGYSQQKIDKLRVEFLKPVEERRFEPRDYMSIEFTSWLEQVREQLYEAFAEVGSPETLTKRVVENEIIGITLEKLPLSDIARVKRSMEARARTFLAPLRRAAEGQEIAATPRTPTIPAPAAPAPVEPPRPALTVETILEITGPNATLKHLRNLCEAEVKQASEPLVACSLYAQQVAYTVRECLEIPTPDKRKPFEAALKEAGEGKLASRIGELWTTSGDEIPADIRGMFIEGARGVLDERYGKIATQPEYLSVIQVEKARLITKSHSVEKPAPKPEHPEEPEAVEEIIEAVAESMHHPGPSTADAIDEAVRKAIK
ncbi:MAG: hypothetical protein BA864_12550 [Desulfuromonadales bacterium C00003093]|nr:MAG: hypothetical protein BA864_12550 [Desulfuromonadales bacterium C00003093]